MKAQTLLNIFLAIVAVLFIATTILIYLAGGDMVIWMTFGVAMIILRLTRAVLLMR